MIKFILIAIGLSILIVWPVLWYMVLGGVIVYVFVWKPPLKTNGSRQRVIVTPPPSNCKSTNEPKLQDTTVKP